MDAATKFELLREFFDKVNERDKAIGKGDKINSVGVYMPSDLASINKGIEQLVTDGTIDPAGWFLDAGAGKLQVALLIAGVYEIPTLAVEYDGELLIESSYYIPELKRRGFNVSAPLVIQHGNFLLDEVYKRAGIKFHDIATAMNFYSDHLGLARKIAKEGKKGTVFIFHGPDRRDFSPLKFEREIILQETYRIDKSLYIYRK